ncbi:UDP-N-acetylmuramoylalanine--D-glutamate ligase [Methylogaea oryzae]|uniref:UDP-N-acetylmuramoylalanine--D-glutamate ligase n=1 Tax=Methylogaea oryzae TaxID=1295382 RepID=A0A8D4VQK6_9GAMM|nr:UDP-N-acetylmuramoylalanine--D-glutamate ligase [Methylogaea oryzae]
MVVGLGKTGLSVAKFLAGQNIPFAVVDSRERPPALAELREHCPDAAVFLGGFDQPAMAVATHLVVSPGVALDEPAIQRAKAAGARLLGDMDLFACMARAPVVGITGSNGKSTVTTLVGAMAQKAGVKVKVGGNLGTPVLELLDADAELYVLELSSFQLETTELLQFAAATVLNISPDHMDRYPDLAAYAGSKQRIFRGNGVMVLNADDPWVCEMREMGRRFFYYGLDAGHSPDYGMRDMGGESWLTVKGEPLLRTGEILLKGRHNLSNALAALALGDAVGLSRAGMVEALRSFRGLDHRMQFVAEIGGVAWINDSKATNIGACIAALQGLTGKAVLVAGGDGKGADFSPLADVAAEKVRGAVLMGQDADKLQAVLQPVVPTVRVADMKGAVAAARDMAQRGDTVLLSPACASWDQYTDYAHRGRTFAAAVQELRP